jgi:hypothetical protein
MNKLQILLISVISLVLVIFSVDSVIAPHKYSLSWVLVFWQFYVITVFLYTRKNLFLFEPIILFSIYYYFVVLSAVHMIVTDFTTNVFVINTDFIGTEIILFEKTLFLFLFSYIGALLGYFFFRRKKQYREIMPLKNINLSVKLIYIFILIFIILGVANFINNVIQISGGDFIRYFSSVSLRAYQYKDYGGTAFFYNFLYIACYLWFYLFIIKNKFKFNFELIFFIFLFVLTILIMASQGRIFTTITYLFSFFGIYYANLYLKYGKVNNIKFIAISFSIALSGLLLYFFRIISSLNENDMLNGSVLYYLKGFFSFEMLGYYAVDKGNVPNLGVVMKIIDAWENDIGFLYGSSLLTWVQTVFPSALKFEGFSPSLMIKHTWYTHIPGGALPPTGPGEMFLNFGYYCSFIGMIYFGGLCTLMNELLKKYNNYWFLVVYIRLSIGFFALYPKGEFENLSLFLPIMIALTLSMIVVSKYMINLITKRV